MHRIFFVLVSIFLISSVAYGETYKCKSANGQTEISDQPCRPSSKTVGVMQKEYISESQMSSSTEWLSREKNRLNLKAQETAAQEREAERQFLIRQAAQRQAQQKQQEAYERQLLIQEVQNLRYQQEETAAAVNRAAANNSGGGGGKRGPVNCYQKMMGRIICD